VFGVNIIPHTAAVTTFGTLQPGGRVNIEIDTLARYVARLVSADRDALAAMAAR
jgi:riboflavin synthase